MSRSRKLADLLDANGDVKLSNLDNSTALPLAGGAMTGAITTNSTFDGVDIATRDGILSSTTTTANAALPKAGGAMTGAITTNSTFDGRDVSTDGTKLDGIAASANNYVHPNHSGDVTSSADGATTIADNAVTTAKIAGDAITALKIADDVINATHIEDGQILTAALGDDAVTAAKLANSINTDIATGVTANTTANAALPKSGGAMTGAITTNSTFDGVDIATRDAVLTSTTTTANAALPKAGGTLTGDVNMLKTSGNSEFKVEASGTDAYATVRVKNDAKDYSMQIRSDESDALTIRDETASANRLLISSTGTVTVGANAVGTMTTDNDGSFAMSASNNFKCTPSGNFTLTFTSIVAQSGNILLVNSGGHTVAAHANTKVDANFLATVSTAGTYLLAYFSDGTNVYMTNSAIYT